MRPSTSPVIEGGDLRLRPLERSDIEAWYAYLKSAHVLEHTSWKLASIDDLRVSIDNIQSEEPGSSMRFAIESVADTKLVGTIGFHSVSAIHRTAELAFDLDAGFWGRGIMPRCCVAVIDWGLSIQGFVRIQATALESNRPSIRVLEKCGFLFEGTLRNFRLVRGEPRNFRMYSRIAP